jgi:hypothetical protein
MNNCKEKLNAFYAVTTVFETSMDSYTVSYNTKSGLISTKFYIAGLLLFTAPILYSL